MPPGSDVEQPEGWNEYRRLVLSSLQELNRQMQSLSDKVDLFRASAVSQAEFHTLEGRVNALWDRDLGARADWEEMLRRVGTMWEERAQKTGAKQTYRLGVYILGAIATALAIIASLQALGVIVVKHP